MRYKKVIIITVLASALFFMLINILFYNATPMPKRVTSPLTLDHGPDSEQLARELSAYLAAPMIAGNRIDLMRNGEQIFPAQFELMRSAQHHIHLETYQFQEGRLTGDMAEILFERLEQGVEVRIILDYLGSVKAGFDLIDQLMDRGAEVIRWREPAWYELSRLNHRTHRKLLIVDGQTAFIGGANNTDNWLGTPATGGYRDNHYRVSGPIVNQLQTAFMENWVAATGTPLFGSDYFPELAEAGQLLTQVVISTPLHGRHRIRKMKLIAFASARDHIRLGTAYFYPDKRMRDALLEARKRGVEIDIISPGTDIDKDYVRKASRSHWGELLEAGVRFHEYQPSMFHAKLMIIDDYWVSIGSANMDNRSFRINDEANLNVFDHDFAASMIDVFTEDLTHTVSYDLERWQQRTMLARFRGWIGRIIGPHL